MTIRVAKATTKRMTTISAKVTVKETLKNDPISLFPPLESVIFDLAARFNPFLGSFWVF